LTRVPSDRRKRAGPEPSGEKERRYTNKYGNHAEKEEERVRLLVTGENSSEMMTASLMFRKDNINLS
jgi:hypothetical protein